MNDAQPRPRVVPGPAPTDSLSPESRQGEAARTAAGLRTGTELPPELADHPRYRVVRLLGQGGMGAVYQAEHRLMNRKVALKVISRSLTERPAAVERFRQEVRAAGRLDHPNIVHAYDAEQAGDTHFLVMEYVEGTDLARLVQERGPLPVAQACHFVRQAALGLQHAYEHGMVHRDIKPHNLMVTARGRVKVLDFGLARFASEAGNGGPLTQSGAVLGTPDYIAPEQALDAHAADIRADLYSLGCTLYHLLSGRVPFPGDSLTQKLLAHQLSRPEPLGKLRPGLPPGLVAVVERLMAKKPEERYQSPAEVAQALAPYARQGPAAPAPSPPRAGGTLLAGEGRVIERAPAVRRGPAPWRWVAAAAVTAVLVGSLFLLAAAAVYRIQTDKGELVIETDDPDVEVIVKQNGRQVTIVDAKTGQKAELNAGTYELALSGKSDGLSLSTDRLTLKRGDRKIVEVRRHPVAEAPAGPADRPAPADEVGEVRRFDVFAPHHIAFSPDGKYALCGQGVGDQGKVVSLWDVETGKEVRRFLGHEAPVRGNIGFSRDGRLAFSGAQDNTVRLWDVATGQERKRFKGYLAALTPDARQVLASVGEKGADLVLYDAESGEPVRTFRADRAEGAAAGVAALALSPDGRTAFTSGYDKVARLWDVKAGKELRRCEGEFVAEEAAFSADGRLVLAGAYLFDVATGKLRHCFADNAPGVYGAALAPDGRRALAGCTDNTVRLWDVATGKELHCFRGHTYYVRGVAFAPDGRTALSCSWDNTMRLWRFPK